MYIERVNRDLDDFVDHLYSQLPISPLELRLGGESVHAQDVKRVQLIFRDLHEVVRLFTLITCDYC